MVSQVIKAESVYSTAFHELQKRAGENEPTWLRQLRENAFARFEELGFPTTKHEEWKYTNVAPLAKTNFEYGNGLVKLERAQAQRFFYKEALASRLVFVNGQLSPELSSIEGLPESIAVLDLRDALKDAKYAEIVREQLARSADYNENAFVALNTALHEGGAFIHLPKGVSVEAPIHLQFLTGENEAPTVSFPRVLVVAEEGSSATVIESYASAGENSYFTNAVVEIDLADTARLNYYKVQRESAKAFHIATSQVELGRDSSFNSTTITLGAQLSRHNIGIAFEREGGECWVDGLYIVGDGQHTDTHSLIDHRPPHCTSHQLYKGILDGKSRAVFNGKVFVRRDAQQTDAMQANKNLLLSNEARVDTKPQLEIFADDVKCAHGATVGQLEEEELFYLESRGLHTDLARNLLTYGFAEEVIEKIKIESIRAELDEAVLNRLQTKLEA